MTVGTSMVLRNISANGGMDRNLSNGVDLAEYGKHNFLFNKFYGILYEENIKVEYSV